MLAERTDRWTCFHPLGVGFDPKMQTAIDCQPGHLNQVEWVHKFTCSLSHTSSGIADAVGQQLHDDAAVRKAS